MDASRKANRQDNEKTLQYQSRQDAQLVEELNQDNLTQLLATLEHLAQSPSGRAELQRRTTLFGECLQFKGETSGQFSLRLRHWLDRDVPPTKSPLHAPRQTGE